MVTIRRTMEPGLPIDPSADLHPAFSIPTHPIGEFMMPRLTAGEIEALEKAGGRKLGSTKQIEWAIEALVQDALYRGAMPQNIDFIRAFKQVADFSKRLHDALTYRNPNGKVNYVKQIVCQALGMENVSLRKPLEKLSMAAGRFASSWEGHKYPKGAEVDEAFRRFLRIIYAKAMRRGVGRSVTDRGANKSRIDHRADKTPKIPKAVIRFAQAALKIAVTHGAAALPNINITPGQRQVAAKVLKDYKMKTNLALTTQLQPICIKFRKNRNAMEFKLRF